MSNEINNFSDICMVFTLVLRSFYFYVSLFEFQKEKTTVIMHTAVRKTGVFGIMGTSLVSLGTSQLYDIKGFEKGTKLGTHYTERRSSRTAIVIFSSSSACARYEELHALRVVARRLPQPVCSSVTDEQC